MPAAGVKVTEQNLTYNVSAETTIYSASVFPAKRGLVDRYNSANTTEEFIKKSTPNEWIDIGYHVGYYDALQILQQSNNYGFIRAANNPLYGSATLVHLDDRTFANDTLNFSGTKGFESPKEFDLSTVSGKDYTPIVTITKSDSTTFSAPDEFIELSEDGDTVKIWEKSSYDSDPSSDPLVAGTLVINTDGKIQVYEENSDDIYSLPNSVTSTEFVIENTSNALMPEGSYSRCILIYDYSPGDFNVSIKVYPYRFVEVIPEDSFDYDNSEIVSTQDWDSTEPIRFTTTSMLPNGIEQYITYYLQRNPETGNYKILDARRNPVTITGRPRGVVRVVPIDNKCTIKGCFTIEVFTSKSRNTPVETFIVSRHPDLLNESGVSTYITEVLEQSSYIRAIDNTSLPEDYMPMSQHNHLYLRGGSFGGIVTDSHMIKAAQILRNSTEVPVTLISDAGWATVSYQNELINICETRRDCIPIFSVPYSTTVSANALMDTVDYRNGYASGEGGVASTRFGALYTPWLNITDPYNDRTIAIPPSGMVVGLICKNAANTQMWAIPAGYKRGIVTAKSLTHNWGYTLQGTGDIATLVDNQVNPIIKDNEGNLVVWGNETLMTESNDMSALNNSLVMIVIQPAIIHMLRRYATFEFLTADTLNNIQIMITNFLNNIKGNLGVSDFLVICDSSNNTAETHSQNRLVVDVAHIPMNYVKYINYRHTITRSLDSTTIVSSAVNS